MTDEQESTVAANSGGLKKLPGVLSFRRSMIISDGLFFSLFKDASRKPIQVVRHGIRGTQNLNITSTGGHESAKNAKDREVSNIQVTDSAKLAPSTSVLEVTFDLRFTNLNQALSSCAPNKDQTSEEIVTQLICL
jgi:CRISPR-associated protein Csy3